MLTIVKLIPGEDKPKIWVNIKTYFKINKGTWFVTKGTICLVKGKYIKQNI